MDTSQRFLIEVDSDAGIDSEQIKVAVENIGGDVIATRAQTVAEGVELHRLFQEIDALAAPWMPDDIATYLSTHGYIIFKRD